MSRIEQVQKGKVLFRIIHKYVKWLCYALWFPIIFFLNFLYYDDSRMCVLWSNKCMQGLKNIHYELTNYSKYLKEK